MLNREQMDERESEFRDYVAARSSALMGTAFLLTGNRATAEDLVQTALAKTWIAWRRVRAAENVDAYVRRVIANTYASWWRRRWRGEVATEHVPDAPGGIDAMAGVDHRDAMWRLLQRLPRRQRAVLVLRYYEDMSEAEIASALGISVGTVKSQAAKALAKLRDEPAARDLRPAAENGGAS